MPSACPEPATSAFESGIGTTLVLEVSRGFAGVLWTTVPLLKEPHNVSANFPTSCLLQRSIPAGPSILLTIATTVTTCMAWHVLEWARPDSHDRTPSNYRPHQDWCSRPRSEKTKDRAFALSVHREGHREIGSDLVCLWNRGGGWRHKGRPSPF